MSTSLRCILSRKPVPTPFVPRGGLATTTRATSHPTIGSRIHPRSHALSTHSRPASGTTRATSAAAATANHISPTSTVSAAAAATPSTTVTEAEAAAAATAAGVADAATVSLRELFDSPLSSVSRSSHASASSVDGLFLYTTMRTPDTFIDSVNAAIARGHLLVERIASAPQRGDQEMRMVIKLFDRLSDVLCKVIDAAEVVRCLHPDVSWRQAAET
ncbi:Mitochondrial intermediate peptidase, partial [Lunasporangiospora selenospora]